MPLSLLSAFVKTHGNFIGTPTQLVSADTTAPGNTGTIDPVTAHKGAGAHEYLEAAS